MKDTGNPDHDDLARKELSSSARTRKSVTPKMCKHTGFFVKGVSGTPMKVRFMAQNKSCGFGSAQPMNEFPIPLTVIGLGSSSLVTRTNIIPKSNTDPKKACRTPSANV